MRKILVADDEIRTRLLYEEIMADAGYKVIAAKDGREACERFISERPVLVILDIEMAGTRRTRCAGHKTSPYAQNF